MKKQRWCEEEISIVRENWLKLSVEELQKLLPNRTIKSIRHIGNRLKFNIRKPTSKRYRVNDNFFSIPNPINSYLAGFISADGSIDIDAKTFINRLAITQADRNVLELFSSLLEYNGKIQTRKVKPSRNSVVKKDFTISILRVSSKQITHDLINNFHILPNKTLVNKPPNLDHYNSLCFIIGLIDGDGSISIVKKGKYKTIVLSLVGSKEICEWVKEILGNKGYVLHKDGCHKNIYQFSIADKQAREIIYKLRSIKELANIRFARKWDKILEWERSRGIAC